MLHIDYPFQFDHLGQTASTSYEDHVRDMIEQFLFTSPGERVNRPDFGSGLLQLIFAPNSVELAGALQFTIQAGLQQWLSDVIDLKSLEVVNEDSTLRITVVYVIRKTGQERQEVFERSAP